MTDDTNILSRFESRAEACAGRMGDAELGDLLFDLHFGRDITSKPAHFREAVALASRAHARRAPIDDELERMLGELLLDAVVGQGL